MQYGIRLRESESGRSTWGFRMEDSDSGILGVRQPKHPQTPPNTSEHFQTRLNTSEHIQTPPKTSKNMQKRRILMNFREFAHEFSCIAYEVLRTYIRFCPTKGALVTARPPSEHLHPLYKYLKKLLEVPGSGVEVLEVFWA